MSSEVAEAPSAGPPRLRAIDGMRGWAAVVVVFHHLMFLDPWLIQAHLVPAGAAGGGTANRLLYYSPLHIIMAGPEAVAVFFALSGAVLVAAYPGRRSLKLSYLLPRLTRLYLPIFAAVTLALTLSSIRPHVPDGLLSPWHAVFMHVIQWPDVLVNPLAAARDLLVLPGPSFLDSPLWSMRVELVASLVLFAIWQLGRLGAKGFVLAVLVSFLCRRTPELNWVTIQLPIFVGGAALFLTRWRASRRQGDVLLVAGVAAMTIPYCASGVGIDLRTHWEIPLTVIGALCFAAAALGDSTLSGGLTGRTGQYLGTRSFSLYLVHFPIVLTAGLWIVKWTGGQPNWWMWRIPLAGLAFAAAEVFYRFAESPAHRLSQSLRRRFVADTLQPALA